jgi:hypothetical protein
MTVPAEPKMDKDRFPTALAVQQSLQPGQLGNGNGTL